MTTMPLRITGGVDTHLDVHVAAALDHRGALLGVESFETTPAGYRPLLGWLRGFGEVELVGVEGTGSYGAGLTRHLQSEGVAVVEVDRPNRQRRRRRGKSDPRTPSPRPVLPSPATPSARPRPETETSRPCGFCGSPLVGSQGPHPGAQPDAQPHLHRPRTIRAELRNLNVYRLLDKEPPHDLALRVVVDGGSPFPHLADHREETITVVAQVAFVSDRGSAESSIPPKSRRPTWRLFLGARAVRKQLGVTDGVIGLSLLARPQAGRDVVGVDRRRRPREVCRCQPHRDLVRELTPEMGSTRFVRWTIRGADGRPSWADPLRRLR